MQIPQGVEIYAEKNKIKVKGPKGEVQKDFKSPELEIKVEDGEIKIFTSNKALRGTVEAHIKNMIFGVQNGYEKRLKIIYAHFPFTFEVKGKTVFIKNLLGEKKPRQFEIVGDTNIQVKGQEVIVSGIDKEAVGQTIANMKRAMKIKEKDCRVFQDGVYIIGDAK